MIMRNLKLFYFSGLVILLALNVSCGTVQVGELQVETQSVELGKAESVRAEIEMGSGTLKIAGGADQLLHADFSYNVAEWKPEVDYQIENGTGLLTVQQPLSRGIGKLPLGNARNEWDLRFNNDVPLRLIIDFGAGENNLYLGHLTLTSLEVNTGAGNVTLDLTGNPSLTKMFLNQGAGDVKVDLTGDWKENMNAQINSGVGRITLRLPNDQGLYVRADRGIGQINAPGLKKHDGAYVNESYGESEVTLYVNVEEGIGQINLELAD